MNVNLGRMRRTITPSGRGWQMAFVAIVVGALLSMTSLRSGTAWGATGGLPGTGNSSFNPAGDSEGNHCLSPNGADVNELLGVSEFLLVPGACEDLEAGEFYILFGPGSWMMGPAWLEVPGDFVPSAPTPLEDFLAKVRSFTFTVDPGTPRERSYRFQASDIVEVISLQDLFEEVPDFPVAVFLGKLPPLAPGDHRVAYFIEMADRHCDGLGSGLENCLAAGTTRLGSCLFTVVPPEPPVSRRP